MSCEFANIVYTVSYTIAKVSLKILVWANNNVQRYINLSTPVDEKFARGKHCITGAIQTYSTISDV